jgi:hypothetical protein
MNQFSAKKLGEVLAFARGGLYILKNGQAALEKIFGAAFIQASTKMTMDQQKQIGEFAEHNQVLDAVNTKADRTEEKLKQMQDLYLQDKWDDESELLEWMGFFEGAALVHWKLVEGVAQYTDDSALPKLARAGLMMHQDLLFKIAEAIRKIGYRKASAE